MNKLSLSLALVMLCAPLAWATPGNNGGGNGGCGVGQQTNGCGNTTPVPGPQGPQGPKGDTGAQGPRGETGATGATGAQGPKGDTGTAGSNGKDGADGRDGKAGTAGAQGKTGANAPDAVTAQQLDAANKRSYAGTAGAVAIASMPQAIEPDSSMVTVGAGAYRNEAAIAVGMSYRANDWVFKGGVGADTRGGVSVGVGAGFRFK